MFDCIGTLIEVRGYRHEDSLRDMYRSLVKDGFHLDQAQFLEAYRRVYEHYRRLRHETLMEVTNAIWIAAALNALGFDVKPESKAVRRAVNAYFEKYFRSLRPRRCARQTLGIFSRRYRVAVVSNFTYAPVIYAVLRKYRLNAHLRAVVVSDEVGWRKPHPKIFMEALRRVGVEAEKTVFVGDNPIEDIKGAKNVGMKTIFIASQYFTTKDLEETSIQPDATIRELCELVQADPPLKV